MRRFNGPAETESIRMTAMTKQDDTEFDGNIRRDPKQVHRRQRGKNLAVAGALIGFVAIIYLVSIVKISGRSTRPWIIRRCSSGLIVGTPPW